MTSEMIKLYEKLHTIKVKSIGGAYDYLGNEMNRMDMNGTLDLKMTSAALKNINKDYKNLKKYYKGKIQIKPKSVYEKYDVETQEHYFLKCLVVLMQYNI